MGYDIARKIQQLVALAESTNSAEEADACMQKARLMLERHGLSLLSIKTAVHDDPVGITREAAHFYKSEQWNGRLVQAAATLFGVEIVYTQNGNRTNITAFGRESCRAVFGAMYPYLRKSVQRQATKAFNAGEYASKSRAASMIGRALAARIWRLIYERREADRSPMAAAGINALVPVDYIEIMMRREFGDLRPRQDRKWLGVDQQAIDRASAIGLAWQLDQHGVPIAGRLIRK